MRTVTITVWILLAFALSVVLTGCSYAEFNDFFTGIGAFVTAVAVIIGGGWVFYKYIRQWERYPYIEFTADISVIGQQAEYWIVELNAIVENKGKVLHRMKDVKFNLDAIYKGEAIEDNSKDWLGQVIFPHSLRKEQLLIPVNPPKFYFIAPGVKAKYSYIAQVPDKTTFLNFHCWFMYVNPKHHSHTAEKTIRFPESKRGS